MSNQRHGWMQWAGPVVLAGCILLGGCATKNSTAMTSNTEHAQAGMGGPAATAQTNQNGENRDGGQPISGFTRNPLVERVTQPAPPVVVAKADSAHADADAARQEKARQLADIYFAFDKWNLSAEGKKNLVDSVQYLKQHPDAKFVIEGYCDERGSREYNLVLGEKRARASMRYLTALGIKNPLSFISYGKERQVCGEHDESCYWKNRRAHLTIQDGR